MNKNGINEIQKASGRSGVDRHIEDVLEFDYSMLIEESHDGRAFCQALERLEKYIERKKSCKQ